MANVDMADQVVIVTGAARGLGASHARELSRRGASVVLTDLADPDGRSRAEEVAASIVDAGGRAIALAGDVRDPVSADAAVAAALERFGRLDALVHNAGLTIRAARDQGVPTDGTITGDAGADRPQLDVNLTSAFGFLRAAWPIFLDRGYGRVVMTSSGAIFGAPPLTAYAAAKAGVMSLARSAALEAASTGSDIRVNAIAPMASTGPLDVTDDEQFLTQLTTTSCTSVAVALASPICPTNGECIRVGAGYVARVVLALTSGWLGPTTEITAEDVVAAMPEILDDSNLAMPASAIDLVDIMRERVASRPAVPQGESPLDVG